jgi:integrase
MTDDIHNYEQRLESTHQNILHKKTCQNCNKKTKDEECLGCGSEDLQHIIREENRELATDFKEHQADRELSFSRRYRYLISLKKMMEYNDFRLDNLKEDEENKQKIRKLLRQIKDAAYCDRLEEYSAETEKEYKSAIKRLLEFQGLSSDREHTILLPDGFTAYVPEKDRNHTPPKDLPNPSDVRKLAQKLQANSENPHNVLRPAILLTLWDSGSRIGECLTARVGGVRMVGKTVKLDIPGNKESPDRNDVPCSIAAPIIKQWLECHPEPDNPDAYLFCNPKDPTKPASYSTFTDALKDAAEEADINCKLEGEVNHVFRKGRISYLKKADIMSESKIDRRVGHKPGSSETRTYTRLSDEEAGNDYLSGYGQEEAIEDEIETDILPLKCEECGAVNSGHRNACKECSSILDEENYLEGVEVESKVSLEVEEKTNKLNERMRKNHTPVDDEKINEQARKLVAEEYGVEPEELQ